MLIRAIAGGETLHASDRRSLLLGGGKAELMTIGSVDLSLSPMTGLMLHGSAV